MNKATITIVGKEVQMLYCAAAETGYESMSGKSSDVFAPKRRMAEGQPVNDSDGNPIYDQPEAVLDDYLKLGISAIIAAYAKEGKESPVSVSDIIYDAGPQEIMSIVTNVVKIRNEWYAVPSIIESDQPKDEDAQKNV